MIYNDNDFLPIPDKVVRRGEQHKWLVKEDDRLFSLLVRQSYADTHTGAIWCCICGSPTTWRYLDNGHFQGRGYFFTRWNFQNCGPVCKNCNNVGDEAAKAKLGKWLDATHGVGTSLAMIALAHADGGTSRSAFSQIELQILRLELNKKLKERGFQTT